MKWKIFLFVSLLYILVFSVGVFAVESKSTEKIYQDYGANLSNFIENARKNPGKYNLDENDINAFIKGFESSKDEKKVEKLMELFVEVHKDGESKGKNIIDDKFRNEIWKKIMIKDVKKYLSILADKKFREKYAGVLKDLNKAGIGDRINIGNAEKLEWKANKLGLPGKDGKLYARIDFDNLPRWITSINYKDGEFSCDFFTGKVNKKIDFSGGTIGASGELIGPDGNKVGSALGGPLKSIKYDSAKKELSVEYTVDGKTQKLVLTEAMLQGSALQKYKDALEDPKLGPVLKKILENPNGYSADFGVGDSGLGFPADNQLTLLYSYEGLKEDQRISVKFDEDGKPEITSSKGSQFVTTNSKGEAKISYESGSTDLGGNGVYKFDKNGEIYATQNSLIKDIKGSLSAPSDKMIGINIVTNNYVELIAKGESGRKELIETFLKENDIFGKSLKDPSFNLQNELSKIIQRELDNGDFKTALMNQITRATNNLMITSKEASNSLFTGVFGNSAEALQIRDSIYDYTKERIEGAVTDIFSQPETLTSFNGMNSDQRKEFLKEKIKDAFNQDPRVAYTYDNSFVSPILDKVDAIRKGISDRSGQSTPVPVRDVVKTEINSLLDNLLTQGADKQGGLNGAAVSGIIDQIPDSYFGLVASGKDKEAIKATIAGMRTDAIAVADKARNDFIVRLKKDNSLGDYSERAIIDHKLGEVKIIGSGMTYDTRVSLNKFSVDNSGDRDVWLYSNGHPVVSIKGDKTFSIMNPTNRDYSSVGFIVNERTPGDKNILRLEGGGGGVTYCGSSGCSGHTSSGSEYRLSYPGKTVTLSSGTQPGVASKQVWKFDIQIPFSASQTQLVGPNGLDIGDDPDAKLVVTNVAEPGATGFLSRLKNKKFLEEMNKKYPEGKPLGEDIVPQFTKQFDSQMQGFKEKLGGEEQFKVYIENNYAMIQDLQKQGVDVKGMNEVKDMLTLARNPQLYYEVMNFLSKQKLPRGGQLEITPTYISVGGNKYGVENNPELGAVFRTMLRTIRKDPSSLYSPMKIRG